ncbi:MAG: hypothetical protein AB8F74_22415 [Saprospiraceae bacterium]
MTQLKEIISKFENRNISEVICGGNMNGSVVIINSNNNISLKINSVWRLTSESEVLASWDENDNSKESNFTKQLKLLEGDKIISFVKSQFYDISLSLESGKTLFVLCDINSYYSDKYFENNWLICDKELNYCVGISRHLEEIVEVYD